MLDASVDLRDVQIAARHADPRTTLRYDRARQNLDRPTTSSPPTWAQGPDDGSTCGFADDTRFGSMGSRSQHISIGIDRPVTEVYDVAADPLNLPRWAAGLAGSRVEQDGEQWFTESPMGVSRSHSRRATASAYWTMTSRCPPGRRVYNPLRVISDGDWCEVVFTLRQRPEMTDEEFERDADAVAKDLAALKSLVETN